MLGAPTPQMLQEMVDEELNFDRNRYETIYNTKLKDGRSFSDRS
jgi:hypothetical protein